ncbi:MAG: HpcH/HpaI aldolase family protein [Alphaproteobacteria bacterium]
MAAAPRNALKERLARGEVAASMTVRLVADPAVALLARSAGFDTIYVDLEHGPFSIETAARICVAAQEAGLAPLVRVPARGPEWISRVLDGGAMGVIVPHVDSAAEAREAVAAAMYPPLGRRSAAGALPQFGFAGPPAAEAMRAANAATMVVVQLETAAAIAAADEILAVEGVDMALLGANDLLADIGAPGDFDDPRLMQAYARVIDACRRLGRHVGVGGLAGRPDLAARCVAMGARYVSTGTDLGFLLDAATKRATAAHALPR